MLTVWKYSIPVRGGITALDLPGGAEIIHVADQFNRGDSIQLWARVLTDTTPERRKFMVLGTGRALLEEIAYKHVGSVLTAGGLLVWHVFEVRD